MSLCVTAATLGPGTLAHVRGEKKGTGSIDVNYADVTREGAHWSVSPPKDLIKVKQLVSLSFFFRCRASVVSLRRQCVVSAATSTPQQQFCVTADTHETSNGREETSPNADGGCRRRLQPKVRHIQMMVHKGFRRKSSSWFWTCFYHACFHWVAVWLFAPVQFGLHPADSRWNSTRLIKHAAEIGMLGENRPGWVRTADAPEEEPYRDLICKPEIVVATGKASLQMLCFFINVYTSEHETWTDTGSKLFPQACD